MPTASKESEEEIINALVNLRNLLNTINTFQENFFK